MFRSKINEKLFICCYSCFLLYSINFHKRSVDTKQPVPDLSIGSIGWSLGPQNFGSLRPRCIICLTLLMDFTLNVLYFLNNPSVIFLTQLNSISEYYRIVYTPHHLYLYWNWLISSSNRDCGKLGGASQMD